MLLFTGLEANTIDVFSYYRSMNNWEMKTQLQFGCLCLLRPRSDGYSVAIRTKL